MDYKAKKKTLISAANLLVVFTVQGAEIVNNLTAELIQKERWVQRKDKRGNYHKMSHLSAPPQR